MLKWLSCSCHTERQTVAPQLKITPTGRLYGCNTWFQLSVSSCTCSRERALYIPKLGSSPTIVVSRNAGLPTAGAALSEGDHTCACSLTFLFRYDGKGNSSRFVHERKLLMCDDATNAYESEI